MAYYAYKVVRDLIPDEFQDAYRDFNDHVYYNGNSSWSYEGSPDYDGDMWYMVATYIKYLEVKDSYDGWSLEFFKDHFNG